MWHWSSESQNAWVTSRQRRGGCAKGQNPMLQMKSVSIRKNKQPKTFSEAWLGHSHLDLTGQVWVTWQNSVKEELGWAYFWRSTFSKKNKNKNRDSLSKRKSRYWACNSQCPYQKYMHNCSHLTRRWLNIWRCLRLNLGVYLYVSKQEHWYM